MNLDELDRQEEEIVEPFRVTPGFIAFAGALCLPALVALFIVLGAWLVSDEVYAAERAAAGSPSLNGEQVAHQDDVPEWKKTLVGICPIH